MIYSQECEFEIIVFYKLFEYKTIVYLGLVCICEICGRVFKSKSVFKYYIQFIYFEFRFIFICNICGKIYFIGQVFKVSKEYLLVELREVYFLV